MYVKLFSRMLNSSIMDEDLATRWAFVSMLLAADKTGMVYGTKGAIARLANLSLPDFEAALERLLAPDPSSTTPDNDGRRVVMESTNCWRVVNYAHYRGIKDENALRETTRVRVRECRARQKREREAKTSDVTKSVTKALQPVTVTVGNDLKRDVTPYRSRSSEEADLISTLTGSHPDPAAAEPGAKGVFELEGEGGTPGKVKKSKTDNPEVPYQELVGEWNDGPAQAGAVFCTVLAKSWRANIRARWLESVSAGKDPRSMFRAQFEAVAVSKLCTGGVERKDAEPWRASLDWLCNATNWAKVANGNYRRDRVAPRVAEPIPEIKPLRELTLPSIDWPRVVEVIAARCPSDQVDEWIRPLRYVGDRGEVVELEASDDFQARWVEDNFQEQIRDSLREVVGRVVGFRVVAPGRG